MKKYFICVCLILFTLPTLIVFPICAEGGRLSAARLDFSLKTIEGEKICLKDYRGKKIVHLLLWAAWCPHCLREMPKLRKLYNAIGDRPYEILAIDIASNDSLKRIKQIQEKYQIPCKILFDKKGELIKSCGVVGVPLHIVIDKEGIIRDRFTELPEDPTTYLNKMFPYKKIIF